MSVKDRIDQYIAVKGLSRSSFEKKAGLSNAYIRNFKGRIGEDKLECVLNAFPDLNKEWLLSGEGEMRKTKDIAPRGNLIPFYDSVSSIGGNHDRIANVDGISEPAEYIDAGDWFRNATAAIRHYGDSMVEYPPGCILALKEVIERQLVVWGKDYVIETNEYRVTKRVQRGNSDDHIRAYSSNTEAYPDGRLIHEPLDIAWKDVRRIFLVLGYVVNKNGGTMLFNKSK